VEYGRFDAANTFKRGICVEHLAVDS